MEYEIDVRHKSVRLDGAFLEWSKDAPMSEGVYFASWVGGGIDLVNVKFNSDYILEAWVFGREYPYELSEFSHWMGAIPVPELLE